MSVELAPIVVIIAFLFETMDSAAGMGFGTGLPPLLFLMGYEPLQVVPVLLISETITGILAGTFHHEFENVNFSFTRPLTKATQVMLIIAGIGCLAIFLSVLLAYLAIGFPQHIVKTYVAVLVIAMGFIGLFKLTTKGEQTYKPKLLSCFAALGGFNKGIGGGGYGPVIMMGQVFSGIYEKSATAIVSLAEGIVSAVGVIAFFTIMSTGVSIDMFLLPSIFTGGFFAAIIAPYMVRLFPNKAWRIIIPAYAFTVGLISLLKLYVL